MFLSLWLIQNLWALPCNELATGRFHFEAQKYVRSQQHRPAPLVAGIAVMVREMINQNNFLPLDESVREMDSVLNSLTETLTSIPENEYRKIRNAWESSASESFGRFESLRVLNTSYRKNFFSRQAAPHLLVESKNWTNRASLDLYEKVSMINPTDRIWIFRRRLQAAEVVDLADRLNDQAHELDYRRIQILNLEEKALLGGGKAFFDTLQLGIYTGGASLVAMGVGAPEMAAFFSGSFFWYLNFQRTLGKTLESIHTQRTILNQLVQAPLTRFSHVHLRMGGMKPYIESLRTGRLSAQDLREQFWMAHSHGDRAIDRVVQEGRGMSLEEYYRK
ncbi:MAG: hypothetical protein WCH11_04560, partial [Bdellovibrio sp.]